MRTSKVLGAKTKPDKEAVPKRTRMTYTPEERAQRKIVAEELTDQKRQLAGLKRVIKEDVKAARTAVRAAGKNLRLTEKKYASDLNKQQKTVNGLLLALEKIGATAAARLGA